MKRFLFIFVFMLLLSCSGGVVVQAADSNDIYSSFDDLFVEHYSLEEFENSPYYVDISYPAESGVWYFRMYSTEPIIFTQQGYYAPDFSLSNMLAISGTEFSIRNVFLLDYYDDSREDYISYDWSSRHLGSDYDIALSRIVSSSHNIVDDNGNVVFQKPSEPLGIPREILAQIITQENPLKEILVLLPMVIPCLVGYVALRKGLRTLVTILRTV